MQLKTPKTVSRSLVVITLIALILIGGGLSDVVIESRIAGHPETQTAESPYNDLLQRNLDLRVAAKATYKASGPLFVEKEYGVVKGVKRRLVSFDVDGIKEYAYMTLPTTPMPDRGYPVIILVHGFVRPNRYATEGNGYLPDMQFYSKNGYAVIRPDLRGHGLSAGTAEGAYYSMVYNIDMMYLISAIKQSPELSKGNINTWGHSMGAYVALRAAVVSSDIRSVIMLAGPVGTLKDMFTLYVPPSDRLNPIAQQIRTQKIAEYGTPVANPKYWYNTSPLNFIGKTKAYMQLHVGTNDEVVPPVFSQDLSDALDRQHKAHEYFVYEGADHGLVGVRQDIWSRSLHRLNEINKSAL